MTRDRGTGPARTVSRASWSPADPGAVLGTPRDSAAVATETPRPDVVGICPAISAMRLISWRRDTLEERGLPCCAALGRIPTSTRSAPRSTTLGWLRTRAVGGRGGCASPCRRTIVQMGVRWVYGWVYGFEGDPYDPGARLDLAHLIRSGRPARGVARWRIAGTSQGTDVSDGPAMFETFLSQLL